MNYAPKLGLDKVGIIVYTVSAKLGRGCLFLGQRSEDYNQIKGRVVQTAPLRIGRRKPQPVSRLLANRILGGVVCFVCKRSGESQS